MNIKMKIMNRAISNVCIIGDIHSSSNELRSVISQSRVRGINKFILLGDLWDRGYDPNGVIDVVAELLANGELELVLGNHDYKFIRHFAGQKVSIANEQIETLSKLTHKTIESFIGIFSEMTVAIYDPTKKIFISHAAGGRPADIFGRDFQKSKEHNFSSYNDYLFDKNDKLLEKKHAANLMYGITNGSVTENGRPVRLPITIDKNDDLEGWLYIFGHHHFAELFPENGNMHCVCLDYCSGEKNGKLAGLIIKDTAIVSEENLIFSE